MILMTRWSKRIAAATTAAALAVPAASFAQDAKGESGNRESERQTQTDRSESNERTLKVFELKHCKPQEMQRLLALQSQAIAGRVLALQTAPGQTTVGYRGIPQGELSVATDGDKKLLFVRGTENRLEEAEQLIQAFDTEADDLEKKDVGDVRLIPIRTSNAAQVQAVLGQLQLPAQMARLGKASVLVVPMTDGNEKDAEQIEKVVSELKADEKSDQDRNADEKDGQETGDAEKDRS